MGISKRTRLKFGMATWLAPIINAVTLPVHAQTSVCGMSDLAGTWRMISSTHFVAALNPTFELRVDGSTSDAASFWETQDHQFMLRQDVSDFIFMAELATNCSHLSGTSTTAFTFPPHNLPANGVWRAKRISP